MAKTQFQLVSTDLISVVDIAGVDIKKGNYSLVLYTKITYILRKLNITSLLYTG